MKQVEELPAVDLQRTVLPNGLRLVTNSMRHVGSVAVGVWVGVGGRHEARRSCGISHFIEHLLFKGTERLSAREISRSIEGRGGYFNAFTSEEATCFYAHVSARDMGRVAGILSEMYCSPRFAEEDIEKERGVILEELLLYRDQPQHLVQDELQSLLWPGHALGRSLVGSPKCIRSLQRTDILDYKRRCYVPSATVVAASGRIEHPRLLDALSGPAALHAGRRPSVRRFKSAGGEDRLRVLERDIGQVHLALASRIFGRHDRRRYALKLLSVILGENMSSRLFQVVRERHGLAYAIHSGAHLYEDTGSVSISAGLDRRRLGQAMGLISRELQRLATREVPAAELRRARDYAIGQLVLGLEGTSARMSWLGEQQLLLGRIRPPHEVVAGLKKVTPPDIRNLAAEIFSPARLQAALVVPLGAAGAAERDTRRALLS